MSKRWWMNTERSRKGGGIRKRLRSLVAYMFALPLIVMVRIKPGRFKEVAELASIIPMSTGNKIRYEFYRRTIKSCGEDVTFHFGTRLNYTDISIGDNVSFGRFNSVGMVDVGDNVLTAGGVMMLSGRNTHNFDDTESPINSQGSARRKITIDRDVWIGVNAVVMEDVGEGCVIGAGSVVTKALEPFSVAVGNPARVLRKRGVV